MTVGWTVKVYKHEGQSEVDSVTSYFNLNQTKKESQIAIGFLELEEVFFIFSCKLNSFMHRREKASLD